MKRKRMKTPTRRQGDAPMVITGRSLLKVGIGHCGRSAGCGAHKDQRPNRLPRSTQKIRLKDRGFE